MCSNVLFSCYRFVRCMFCCTGGFSKSLSGMLSGVLLGLWSWGGVVPSGDLWVQMGFCQKTSGCLQEVAVDSVLGFQTRRGWWPAHEPDWCPGAWVLCSFICTYWESIHDLKSSSLPSLRHENWGVVVPPSRLQFSPIKSLPHVFGY